MLGQITMLSLTLMIMTGCITTATPYLTAEEEYHLEQCAADNSRFCVRASIDAAKARQYSAANTFAKRACSLGSSDGCQLVEDLEMMNPPAIYRTSTANSGGGIDASFINLMQESANQAGTLGGRKAGDPRPVRTNCTSKWNAFLRQTETACDQE